VTKRKERKDWVINYGKGKGKGRLGEEVWQRDMKKKTG
jgi:hypothetical protein